ncbi:adhesion G-protein coupled receptor G6-like isoform X2 [Cynoglossus semilaevis]|uniref:adhesion G-protein coupled receptor G6-like isoform X2 n=1 Tax=Cynoglossus semilaevis TaxID=244447 RepID=UPI000D62CB65|nr:adhesion G-protein coupled receptor G6-like isoform X2 [Cynoglossus semilaevis]
MDSLDRLSISLCLTFLLSSASAAAGSSPWGKTVQFSGRPCLWQLQGDPGKPSLNTQQIRVPVARAENKSRKNPNTADQPDNFFRVELLLHMTGTTSSPTHVIKTWVTESLEKSRNMLVLNLVIKDNDDKRIMNRIDEKTILEEQWKEYNCSFHVQEFNQKSIEETMAFINLTLSSKYENCSIVIEAIIVEIQHILPKNCLESKVSTIYGDYTWPETFPHVIQVMVCKKPAAERAYRLCEINFKTDTTMWAKPDFSRCYKLMSFSDLDNITVTDGNAAEVVEIIQDLVKVHLGNSSELSSPELVSVINKLHEVVNVSAVNANVGSEITSIISDLMLSQTDLTPLSNMFLHLTERLEENLIFSGESESLTAPSVALSMVNVQAENFKGLTFGVSLDSPSMVPKTFVNQTFSSDLFPDADATISVPVALQWFFTENRTRVNFQFYGTYDLFQEQDNGSSTLSTYVISASVRYSPVSHLTEPVAVTFRHHKVKQPNDKVQCVFWDFQKHGGSGGWMSSGCETQSVSPHQTTCLCDHLTHFAVLLDVSRTPISDEHSYILTLITYLGCGISSIFLGITLITHLAFDLVFLLDSWLSSFSDYSLCITTAATLHYFLLASFTWMGLEGVHMYLALVKVFNRHVPSYILKFSAVGWGLPLVVVFLVLVIDKDAYGDVAGDDVPLSTESFCWLTDDVVFYVTVVTFVLLILLCNISVFVVVLIQIRRMRNKKPLGNSPLQDLRAVASLTVLLGLTWSMGFFSFGPGQVVLMYLFSIFNTLQGFFVFFFHCLMKESVRKQWRIHLCVGRFRLDADSDWSRSVTVGGLKKDLIHSDWLASQNSTSRTMSKSSAGCQ